MEQWFLYTKKADFSRISGQFNISPMLARILRNRDVITDSQIINFLYPDKERTYDPFLMKDMEKGIELARKMVTSGKKIRIIGDYDTDGICSSLILSSFFESQGADVDVRLPDRVTDGYGMNTEMVREALSDHISLIITCDNGISCIDAVKAARENGMHVIITDHHEPGTCLPDADAVIDAKQTDCQYPFKEICGAAAAYKFVQAYDMRYETGQDQLLDDLLQYVGLATIADIVPVVDENRIFASQGIRRIRNTRSTGLNALMSGRGIEKEKINAGVIGFVLAPCINSAGRLSNAMLAYDLLRTGDEQKASALAGELSALNEQRKSLTSVQTDIALDKIRKTCGTDERNRILTVFLPDAHESLSGIIAGRLKEEFNRPAFVITRSAEGLKGSGRSIESYNMIAGLQNEPDLFLKYGGHPMACGFTLKPAGDEKETIRRFSARMNAACKLKDADLIRRIWIDMELPFKYVTQELVDELKILEPFGLGNEKPVFAGKGVNILSASVLGANRNVLKMTLKDRYGTCIDGIMFGSGENIAERYRMVSDTECINVLFYPDINEFRGRRTPQIIISTFNPADTTRNVHGSGY